MKRLAAAFVVVVTCGVLVSLGVWQLHRLQWKLDLISRIAMQTSVDPQSVSLQTQLYDPANNLNRGYMQGRYLQDKNVRVGPHVVNDVLGYWVISPMKLFGGRIVLINRGWVPQTAGIPAPPAAMVNVAGTLRVSDTGSQAIAGDVSSWHKLDVAGITKGLNLPDAAPMVLFMETSKPADDASLRPAPATAELRNDHLQYAIFWFALAGILFLSFVALSFRGKR